ncbi:MAG: hypothetical protein IPJ40_20685 [Saprospirales bacterium]|nr:hypothetical protein [Saprospirales bacterium]
MFDGGIKSAGCRESQNRSLSIQIKKAGIGFRADLIVENKVLIELKAVGSSLGSDYYL